MKHSLKRVWIITLSLALGTGLLSWLGARAEHHSASPELRGVAARAYLAKQGLAAELDQALARAYFGIHSSLGNAFQAPITQQAYFKGSNTDLSDGFGSSVAVSGDTVVIGAVGEAGIGTGINGNQTQNEVSAKNAGAAYVFVRNGTEWSQQAYLKGSNTESDDQFGFSVAIWGDTIVVGARTEHSGATGVNGNQNDNSAPGAGAAYVFVRNGTTWTQQAYLKASNTEAGDNFGQTLALVGNTLVVGAPLEDSATTGINGEEDDESATDAGAAYVFVRNGTTWTQQAYLKASNTKSGDSFGQAVALFGDTVAIGAPFESSNATGIDGDQDNDLALSAGAAYVFVRSGTTWTQQAYVKASNTEAEDILGSAVALSGDTLVVGASLEDSNATGVNGNQADNSAPGSGSAYVFVRSGGAWSQQTYLKASNTGFNDQFSNALALSSNTLIAAANLEDSNATGIGGNQTDNSAADAGAAYAFAIANTSEPTIGKAFSPASIAVGDSSTVTLTLTNSQTSALTGASFTDTLTGLSALGGAVGGTCAGTMPSTLSAGATALSFSSITIPASGSCTVTFAVTSNLPGTKTNQTSGVTTTQTPTAGNPSNVATLTVTPPASTPVVTITDPSGCTGPGDLLTVTVTTTNPTSQAQTFNLTVALPANLVGVPGTGTSNVGTPPVVTTIGVTFETMIAAGKTATLTYQVQIGDAPSGASLCINTTSTSGGTPNPPIQTCVTTNCPPSLPFPTTSEVSDQKVGSVLVYNLYSSSVSAPNKQNTRISLTNLNSSSSVAVQLFFVDGATCSVNNESICLAKNQTTAFLASDIDPGMTGYLVAVASDVNTGCPINFNFLVGSAFVNLASGHQAKLNAEAFTALEGGLPTCNATSMTAQLNFDGISYNRVPRALVVDTIAARAEGNDTLVVLNRLGGNLATGAAILTDLFGVLYDDTDNSLIFAFSAGACQFRSSLSNNFPRTTQRFDQFIPAGHSGWAKFYAQNDQGILGAVLNFNPNVGKSSAAFSGGGNMHTLSLTAAASLIIPISPPNCQM